MARMEQMMSDSKLREGYFTEAKERIDALEQGPEFYKLVNR